ncbi:AAA family ATPase [Flagellimonas sp.]|uniref:AAA family ATPase n=1 Tax=Flagellimonas sp. TaxID=2058762 RepID=UPI003F4A367A
MKLSFLWVEKFRDFENQGFNFSSSVKFKYSFLDHFLYCQEERKLPENFFGKGVTGVTGVVGRNGSGKSNLLELICKSLKRGKSLVTNDFFLIFENNDEFHCYHSFKGSSPRFRLSGSKIKIKYFKYQDQIKNLKVVFFSNVFDQRLATFDDSVVDISNNKRYSKKSLYRRNSPSDFSKQVDFIESKHFHDLNISKPRAVRITSKVWSSGYNSITIRKLFGEHVRQFNSFKSVLRNRLRDTVPSKKFYNTLVFAIFLDTVRDFKGIDDSVFPFDDLLTTFLNNGGLNYTLPTNQIIDNLLNWLRLLYDYLPYKKENTLIQDEFDFYRQNINFLYSLKYPISELDIKVSSEGIRNKQVEYFYFDYAPLQNLSERISENRSILQFSRAINISNQLEIDWLGISSGHKAYLNLFSLVYDALTWNNSNTLICFDEADLYLHPSWQTEFFEKMISIIPRMYSGQYQFIISSHSPFLISNLPRQCLLVLENSGGQKVIDGVDLFKETFAGNLYSLFSEPLFLGEKRMSSFAEKTIINIEKAIENAKNEKQLEQIRASIELIGDEVIRGYLINRLSN